MREIKMSEKQKTFRQEYRDATPSWYRGELHLGFTLAVTFGTLYYCWSQIDNATRWEWLLIIPMFLFGNYIEWAAHRYILHRPINGLRMVYQRHVHSHHRFFTHEDLSFQDQKDWRALLFPPFAPVMFILSAVPVGLLIGTLWSNNAGYITVIVMAGYYLMYEGLHTLSHIEDSQFLDNLPLVNTVRRMHVSHHHPALMQQRNFNLTFPICDALFGTSDLDRGFWGTLFSGAGDKHMREEDRERFNTYKGGDTP
jgi:sterol desaturase/sphingolipid hydroxylase (fatty acid hydroxylase superfamily)